MLAHIRELVEVAVSRLLLHVLEMDAAFVDANRRACLHSGRSDAPSGDAFSKVVYGRFSASSTFHHLSAHVHQTIEEGAGGDDDALGIGREGSIRQVPFRC